MTTLYALDEAAHATVLAALRIYQNLLAQSAQEQRKQFLTPDTNSVVRDIATNGGTVTPLTVPEINRLCEDLNHYSDLPDYRTLLVRYMARVIDIESVSYVTEGLSHGRIDFEGADLAALQQIEIEVRALVDGSGDAENESLILISEIEDEPARAGDAITDAMLEKAAEINDLDEALRSVMDQVGITTGDVAGLVFSGACDHEWWPGAHRDARLGMLYRWRESEQAVGEPALAVGDRAICKLCDQDIEWSGSGWRDRGGNRGCVPYKGRDGEIVQPAEGQTHVPTWP